MTGQPNWPSAQAVGDAIAAEVERHHDVIAGWIAGSHHDFDAFADAHTTDFTMIDPDGVVHTRDVALSAVAAAHGSRPGLRIRIANVRVVANRVATYEEWHEDDRAAPPRIATAVFRLDRSAPHGLRWAHLHETWIRHPQQFRGISGSQPRAVPAERCG